MLTRSPSRIPTSFQNIRRSQQQQHFSFCPLIFLQSSQQLMRAHKKLFHLFDIFFRRRRHFVGVVAVVAVVVNVVPAPTFARI